MSFAVAAREQELALFAEDRNNALVMREPCRVAHAAKPGAANFAAPADRDVAQRAIVNIALELAFARVV